MRAERERAHAPDGRARRLHERRQVDAAERAHRRRGRGGGQALPHARPDDAQLSSIAGRAYLLTDTVGFIRKLPHQLVEAFKATLEETVLADLILHVVDASEPRAEREAAMRGGRRGAGGDRRRRAAAPAGRSTRPTCSSRTSARRARASATPTRSRSRPRRARGSRSCATRIEAAFGRPCARSSCSSPTTRAAASPSCTSVAGDLERTDRADGVLVRARVPAALAAPLRRVRGERTARSAGRQLPATWSCGFCTPASDAALPDARPRGRRRARPLRRSRRRRSDPASGRASAPGSRSRSPTGHAGLVLPRSGLAARARDRARQRARA